MSTLRSTIRRGEVAVGFNPVEYAPAFWNAKRNNTIMRINFDAAIDYDENRKLTECLRNIVCPI